MKMLAALALSLIIAGGASAQPSPPSGPSSAGPPLAGPPSAGQPSASRPVDPGYVLGSTDKVRVLVYNEPPLSGEFVISGSGTLAFPLIGDVQAGGLTVPALTELLRTRLADGYLRDPKVSVEVLTYRPFYILGEVGRPGEYPYSNGLTVMNAVATAGGFTYRAEKKRIYVRHAGETAERPEPLSPTLQVSPGDTIRIRERYF